MSEETGLMFVMMRGSSRSDRYRMAALEFRKDNANFLCSRLFPLKCVHRNQEELMEPRRPPDTAIFADVAVVSRKVPCVVGSLVRRSFDSRVEREGTSGVRGSLGSFCRESARRQSRIRGHDDTSTVGG